MASPTHLPLQFSKYTWDVVPSEDDGYSKLRLPCSWIEWGKEVLHQRWLLFAQETRAVAGEVNTEQAIYLNAMNGWAFLHFFQVRIPTPLNKEAEVIILRSMDFVFELSGHLSSMRLINRLFCQNRLRYVDGPEIERGTAEQDFECVACYTNLELKPSDNWANPFPAPELCLPEIVDSLPLGRDEKMKFTGMFTLLWEQMNAEEIPYPQSQHKPEMEACSKQLAAAIGRYNALSESEKAQADAMRYEHQDGERRFDVQRAVEAERRAELHAKEAEEKGDSQFKPIPEQAVATECGHRFGIVCLSKWMDQSKKLDPAEITCPSCRQKISDRDALVLDPKILRQYVQGWQQLITYMCLPRNEESLIMGRKAIIRSFHRESAASAARDNFSWW